jgi:hypothetical protein
MIAQTAAPEARMSKDAEAGWSEVFDQAEAHALAEVRARNHLLLFCSRLIDQSNEELTAFLPRGEEQIATLVAHMHNCHRRLETDAAVMAAGIARIEARRAVEPSPDPPMP